MITVWVKTVDGKLHRLGATAPMTAPHAMVFPEEVAWYEKRFGSAVEWIAVDRIDNVVFWRQT